MKTSTILTSFLLLFLMSQSSPNYANILPSPGVSIYYSTGNDLGLASDSSLSTNPLIIGVGLYAPWYDLELQYLSMSETTTTSLAKLVDNDLLGIRAGLKYPIYRKAARRDIPAYDINASIGFIRYSFINKDALSKVSANDIFSIYIGAELTIDKFAMDFLYSPHKMYMGVKLLLWPNLTLI